MPSNRRIALIVALLGLLLLTGRAALIMVNRPVAPAVTLTSAEIYISRPEGASPEILRVTAEGAKAAYDIDSVIFVDTRPVDYYNQTHIRGAYNMPDETIPPELADLPRNTWIITYCT